MGALAWLAALIGCMVIVANAGKRRPAALLLALFVQPMTAALVGLIPVALFGALAGAEALTLWLGPKAAIAYGALTFLHGARWVALGMPGWPESLPPRPWPFKG